MDQEPLKMCSGHLTLSQVMKKYVFILILKDFWGIHGQKYHNYIYQSQICSIEKILHFVAN